MKTDLFDAVYLKEMFAASLTYLERHVDAINALNVFPVPDGDTGTNMYLTLKGVLKAVSGLYTLGAYGIAEQMAEGALMEARGNSGLILSQVFSGIATGMSERTKWGSKEFARGMHSAKKKSYMAVADPVEGTILTVISAVSDAAARCAKEDSSLDVMLDDLIAAATQAVASTPNLLPVLQEAGVVDSGGYGLGVMLEGMRLFHRGESLTEGGLYMEEYVISGPVGNTVTREFLESAAGEAYGYCTQFVVRGRNLEIAAFESAFRSDATSTVVIGGGEVINVHVHTEDPGKILTFGVRMGTLTQVTIQNMDEQHAEYSEARRADHGLFTQEQMDVAVVAVALGDGLEAIFREELGVSRVLKAGDTMNPSVSEIIACTDAVPSENVIFLANNERIIGTAVKASELSRKTLRIVASKTIPEGIAAMLEFNPEKSIDDNVSSMTVGMTGVRTGAICRAVRATTINGIDVELGQIIGVVDGHLLVAGDDPNSVLCRLMEKASIEKAELVTVYSGEGISDIEDENRLRELLAAQFQGPEMQVIHGGQPHYYYLVSIE